MILLTVRGRGKEEGGLIGDIPDSICDISALEDSWTNHRTCYSGLHGIALMHQPSDARRL